MHESPRIHKIASVVYRLGVAEGPFELTSELEARSGNVVLVRALSEKRVYSELELASGRMSKIFRGDIILGALGRRRALRGFAGDVPSSIAVGDVLAVLNRGGVIGGHATDHKDLGVPVACEVLGMPIVDGRIPNLRDSRLPDVRDLTEIDVPPVVIVSGSCMDSGKTLFLSEVTHELSQAGLRIAGGKLTGVACLRDLISLEDHGAVATASFLDCGYPSTAGLGTDDLAAVATSIVGHLAAQRPDLILLELGDGIIGDYGALDLLRRPELRSVCRMHVFCAVDLVAAWGGHRFLQEQGIELDLISGPATDNSVGVEYIERAIRVPAINAHRHPEELARTVARHLGVVASSLPDQPASPSRDD